LHWAMRMRGRLRNLWSLRNPYPHGIPLGYWCGVVSSSRLKATVDRSTAVPTASSAPSEVEVRGSALLCTSFQNILKLSKESSADSDSVSGFGRVCRRDIARRSRIVYELGTKHL